MAFIPEPPLLSVAVSPTVTGIVRYHPVEHVVLLQEMAVVGATVSIWMTWDLAASALPALSTEKNLMVLVADTVKGPA